MKTNLTEKKIEDFFQTRDMQDLMKCAAKKFGDVLQDIQSSFCDEFRDWLVDEYGIFYEECIRDGVKDDVAALLVGDKEVLKKYALAPTISGYDYYGVRQKIIDENKHIIKDAHVKSLEDKVAHLETSLECIRSYR